MHVECAESEASGNFANSVASEICKFNALQNSNMKFYGVRNFKI